MEFNGLMKKNIQRAVLHYVNSDEFVEDLEKDIGGKSVHCDGIGTIEILFKKENEKNEKDN